MKYNITLLTFIVIYMGLIQTSPTATAKEPVNEAIPLGHEEIVLESNGIERRAFLYVPEHLQHKPEFKSKPTPLVIALHGFGSTAGKAIKDTEWSKKAKEESFIVVYPQGSRAQPNKEANVWKNPQSWNDGAGRFHSGQSNINDVAFIKQLITNISKGYKIDSKRIFITGFSNGASMTFRLGAELSDRIAAIAPCAGADWNKHVKLTGKLSIYYITGTEDTLNPINGGLPRIAVSKSKKKRTNDKVKPPVVVSINKWIKALDCENKATISRSKNGVETNIYNSKNGNRLVYTTIEGHGHVWPGSPSKQPKMIVGNASGKLNATDVIWKFFETLPVK